MRESLGYGHGIVRGVQRDAADLGKTLPEMIRALMLEAVPVLYPKIDMGAYRVDSKDIVTMLTAADLNALPAVAGPSGLNLVVVQSGKSVVNADAAVAKEILDFLRNQKDYGAPTTGQVVQDHFTGFGYGWELPVIQFVLAALLWNSRIEVTHQGTRYTGTRSPQLRAVFDKITSFRAATFTTHDTIGIKDLVNAARNFEDLTGEEPAVEEGAISDALGSWADSEVRPLLPAIAAAAAYHLPVLEELRNYQATLQGIATSESDDRVLLLAATGSELRDQRNAARRIRESLTEINLGRLQQARSAVEEMAPVIQSVGDRDGIAGVAAELHELLGSEDFYLSLDQITDQAGKIATAYRAVYLSEHRARRDEFVAAVDEIAGRPEWLSISEMLPDVTAGVLEPLSSRICSDLDDDAELLPSGSLTCEVCRHSLDAIRLDRANLPRLRAEVLTRVQELSAPTEKAPRLERVRLSHYFPDPLSTTAAVDQAIERLRDRLYELVEDDITVILE
jgi:hypothetical protein